MLNSRQKDIPVFFHNGANYDFNLIIPELAKKFKSDMQCIPMNAKKFMSFSVPRKKEIDSSSKDNKKRRLSII